MFSRHADDILNSTEMIAITCKSLENLVEKGENAGYPAFSPFPARFSKGWHFLRVLNSLDCVVKD